LLVDFADTSTPGNLLTTPPLCWEFENAPRT
jgi:hypothetical protein